MIGGGGASFSAGTSGVGGATTSGATGGTAEDLVRLLNELSTFFVDFFDGGWDEEVETGRSAGPSFVGARFRLTFGLRFGSLLSVGGARTGALSLFGSFGARATGFGSGARGGVGGVARHSRKTRSIAAWYESLQVASQVIRSCVSIRDQ